MIEDLLKYNVMNAFTIKNSKTYTAGFGGPISQYDNYLETAQKMINSVEITEVNTEKGNDGNGSSLTTANTLGSLILVNNLTIKRIFWL